ncbi:MAG: response regulator [Limnothrix sp.]|uniref:response regulator n=1 Tax=unclassified Limnothrix TaxID=2632864 RepID=UPI00081DA226|nr:MULTISPECIES: response regulator [unclassified Limnothrix]MEB3119333.1 response regulator [Limnothrix sp.]OCQ89225.1 two-component system response regulator [Limnothrix sp. P13C2]MBD2160484.1 response regulator [Limnothrix sp. FACHB-1083]MBD2191185.1 response regulator [Limnothrix sp. FACHB-1088]MBD2633790.1 response regulator [Limnothrix sp. FACHB-881]
MQGQLSEIDIRSLLHLIELGQRTGELYLEVEGAHPGDRRSWFVFFRQGAIVYCTSGEGGTTRLRDYLHRYALETAIDELSVSKMASISEPEYGYLWALLETHQLEPVQGRNILQAMVHEALFDLLTVHEGRFIFNMGEAIAPHLTSLAVSPLISQVAQELQDWKQLYPYVQSPDLCPVLTDVQRLREVLPAQTLQTFSEWATGSITLRQIARYRQRPLLAVAQALYPYIQEGLVQLIEPPLEHSAARSRWHQVMTVQDPNPRAPRIVCIEDSPAVCRAIEQGLQLLGYDVVGFLSALEAISQVFELRPDLILCDIAMPHLDGYELCAMLRQTRLFRHVPIIMITGREGFLDRTQARLAGATDYLTKPFKRQELKALIERYIGSGRLEPAPEEEISDLALSTAESLPVP